MFRDQCSVGHNAPARGQFPDARADKVRLERIKFNQDLSKHAPTVRITSLVRFLCPHSLRVVSPVEGDPPVAHQVEHLPRRLLRLVHRGREDGRQVCYRGDVRDLHPGSGDGHSAVTRNPCTKRRVLDRLRAKLTGAVSKCLCNFDLVHDLTSCLMERWCLVITGGAMTA